MWALVHSWPVRLWMNSEGLKPRFTDTTSILIPTSVLLPNQTKPRREIRGFYALTSEVLNSQFQRVHKLFQIVFKQFISLFFRRT